MFSWIVVLAAAAPPTQLPALLQLDDALRLGRTQHPALAMTQGQAAAGEAQARIARAGLLPTITGTAQYQRTTANFALRPGSVPTTVAVSSRPPSNDSFNFFNFGATANVVVWDFYQTPGKWHAATASAAALDQNTHAVAASVDYTIRSTYFQAYAAKAMVQVGQENLANQQKHLDQVAGYIAVGQRAEIDLAQAKNDVATARVTLITAQNNYLTAKALLNQAMGVEARLDYDVDAATMPAIDHEQGDEDAGVQAALATRPEVAAARANAMAAEYTVRALQGAWGPSLNLQGAVTDQGIQLNGLTWNWSVGALLTWPLLAGGLNVAQMDQGAANLQVARAQAEAIRQQVRLEVENARLAVWAAKETLEAAGEALSNARERLGYAEGRYETGVGSIIELGDAQVAVTTAAAQQVQAQFQLDVARAALLKALGQGG